MLLLAPMEPVMPPRAAAPEASRVRCRAQVSRRQSQNPRQRRNPRERFRIRAEKAQDDHCDPNQLACIMRQSPSVELKC